MKDLVLQRMDALGCAPSLRALVERLPEDQPVVVKTGRADWLPVAATHDVDAALYVNVRHVHVKLSPADAQTTATKLELRLSEVNGQTGYVFVSADDAADPALWEELDGAVLRALSRHLGGYGLPGTGARPVGTCPRTGLQLPATGWCDDCEQVCA